jgi:hypothetical protein
MWIVAKALKSAALGAAVGIGIAVLMVSLYEIRPFPFPVDEFIERLTFRLCPLFIMGFSSSVKSTTSLVLITLAGNALLYGMLFAVIAVGLGLLGRAKMHGKPQ